ncbi:MAG: hypothetical protein KDI83_17680 [Gammaproteobacteria bacterium]|nr:hypothetical protein [Gammaproteobacteria bacterium]
MMDESQSIQTPAGNLRMSINFTSARKFLAWKFGGIANYLIELNLFKDGMVVALTLLFDSHDQEAKFCGSRYA